MTDPFFCYEPSYAFSNWQGGSPCKAVPSAWKGPPGRVAGAPCARAREATVTRKLVVCEA